MEIETVCNTSDDVLFANVKANSARDVPWVKSVEAHDGQAVIVGGGPSVMDWLPEIRYRKSCGQTIFALNAAAKLLAEEGIEVDHQVVVDARDHNLAFLGFAKHHLLASQCHPSLFDAAKSVTLWHQEYPEDMERFDACLPANGPAHALIGGGTTVGLSAMVLAYALGYRKLHLYGYDSSYRDEKTHAYKQSDPQRVDCIVTAGGKKFRTSLAMARQAELFPGLCDTLINAGCLITLRGDGLLPWQSKLASMTEQEKYTAMWDRSEYRQVSPGEECVEGFLELARPYGWVTDFGCGTGRAGMKLKAAGLNVLLVDFADNCRDKAAHDLPFVLADLREPIPVPRHQFGFCTDVMEHIEPAHVDNVIRNVMDRVGKCFFQISLIDDVMGRLIGHHLHLSIHPMAWWRDTFERLGYRIEWERDRGISAIFLITHSNHLGASA